MPVQVVLHLLWNVIRATPTQFGPNIDNVLSSQALKEYSDRLVAVYITVYAMSVGSGYETS